MPRVRGNAPAEIERDWDALRWIARFRFVDAEVLGLHLGVSRQQASARVRRLEREGLVVRAGARGGSLTWTISATRRGMRALGLPPRRAARSDVDRDKELALAWLVTRLEQRAPDSTVLTERECRLAEAAGRTSRSVEVIESGGRCRPHWPDLVIERPDGLRLAIEFVFHKTPSSRLASVVLAYRRTDRFNEVRLLVAEPSIARTVTHVVREAAPPPGSESSDDINLVTAPWPGLPHRAKREVERVIAGAVMFGCL